MTDPTRPGRDLDERRAAVIEGLTAPEACRHLVAMYHRHELFRSPIGADPVHGGSVQRDLPGVAG